jgi:hypothetical protein
MSTMWDNYSAKITAAGWGAPMKALRVLTITLAASVPATVHAACTQADLAGKWQAYTMSASAGGPGLARCTMTVTANGTIAASSSRCTDHANSSAPMQVGSVKLTDEAACTFNGQFRWAGTLYRILHGTVAKDKRTASGIGTFTNGGFLFVLTEL